MKILTTVMSRQYANREIAYGWDYQNHESPTKPYHNLDWWPSDMLMQLCGYGHKGHYISIDTPDFMQEHFGSNSPVHYALSGDCQVTYLSGKQDFRKIAETADAYIVRHDYPIYGELFEGIQLQNKAVIQIIAGPTAGKLGWQPNSCNHYLLVNSQNEVNTFKEQGLIQCEIFKKPAARRFYNREKVNREYDFLFACWTTSEPRKRFQLFLDGINLYAKQCRKPVNVLIAGDASYHQDETQSLLKTIDLLSIKTLGQVHRNDMPGIFQSADVTIVCSDSDANPQVINESLVSNTPVACASDITGGAFLINEKTGKLFLPDAKSLSDTLFEMKTNLHSYQAKRHSITLDDSCEQIERILEAVYK